MMSHTSKALSAGNVEGAVMDFSSRWIRVAVPETAAVELAKGPWRMDLYINTTAHDRKVLEP